MLRLVVFVLAVYGAAAAVTVLGVGRIVRAPVSRIPGAIGRWMTEFIHCPGCVGFWLGCGCSQWIYPGPSGIWYVDGFVGLAGAWIIHVLLACAGMYDKLGGSDHAQ